MQMLIEYKTVSGTGNFVASSFAYCYYISRLDYNFLFYSQALREYLVPGDCYFFYCSFVMYILPIFHSYKHLKTLDNWRFSDVFTGYGNDKLT